MSAAVNVCLRLIEYISEFRIVEKIMEKAKLDEWLFRERLGGVGIRVKSRLDHFFLKQDLKKGRTETMMIS